MKIIFAKSWVTCVNSGIEFPLSLQCKILKYKILWQLSMEVQDLFSLCKIYHPALIQAECRNVEQIEQCLSDPHVLVHGVKSYRAFYVKSLTTLFSDNIQWNFEISFFQCQIPYPTWLQLDHRNLGPSEIRLFRPMIIKLKTNAFKYDITLCKTLIWCLWNAKRVKIN